MTVPDLSRARSVHVVGIGGAGMSAIAEVLVAMGHTVSGSDLKESPGLERLRSLGVEVHVGHAAGSVEGAELVTISTAVPRDNVEVRRAEERGLEVHSRAETLTGITRTRSTVAVAGTHGKTTTSSMLALGLRAAGLRPSFIIGGEVNEVGSGAVWDEGDLLVVEADESDGTFLVLERHAAVVTSVEPDHVEFWGGAEPLHEAFRAFVADTSGPVVVCADDEGARPLARFGSAVTYGTHEKASYRMVDVEPGPFGTAFSVRRDDVQVGRIDLPVPGLHNARNACAALATAVELGADAAPVAAALGRFTGVARRFEHRGETRGITFIDDYAHLPTEVEAALSAAGQGHWRRVVCVFQPHRFSRTAALSAHFADSFAGADLLAVTDVYASGEAPRPGVTGRLVADAVLDRHPHRHLAWLPRRADVVAWLVATLEPGDLCLTLGAGDLTSVPDEVREVLA